MRRPYPTLSPLLANIALSVSMSISPPAWLAMGHPIPTLGPVSAARSRGDLPPDPLCG